jgi:AcrR family transcriptional regulator
MRRSPEAVDELVLQAARALFAETGYDATTVRQIAARAGVHQPMVYRRFPNKAKLYEAAVLVPFNHVISSYLKTWEGQVDSPSDLETLVRAFIAPVHALLVEHRELALALVGGAGVVRTEGVALELPLVLTSLTERMVPQLEVEAARRGLRVASASTVVVALGMVLGVALLDGLVQQSEAALSSHSLLEEMVSYTLFGVSPRPQSQAPADRRGVDEVLLQRLLACERRAARAELLLEQLGHGVDGSES